MIPQREVHQVIISFMYCVAIFRLPREPNLETSDSGILQVTYIQTTSIPVQSTYKQTHKPSRHVIQSLHSTVTGLNAHRSMACPAASDSFGPLRAAAIHTDVKLWKAGDAVFRYRQLGAPQAHARSRVLDGDKEPNSGKCHVKQTSILSWVFVIVAILRAMLSIEALESG